METENPTLAWARHYLKSGLHPIPVNGKKAIASWRKYQTQAPTDADLERWFLRPGSNVALVLGRGLIAIDLDGEGAEPALAAAGITLPADAPRSQTSETSCHVFLRVSGPVENRVKMLFSEQKRPGTEKPLWQVDVRADGGYIVAPPSIHPDRGTEYAWLRRIGPNVPEASAALLALIKSRPAAGKASTSSDAPKWVSEALQGVGEGQRDDTCARLAGYFLKKGVPADIVKTQLYAFGAGCRPPFSRADVDKTVDSVARKEHQTQTRAAADQSGEFQVLGYNHGCFFYLPRGSRQVVELRAEQHSKLNLMRLAPLQYWEHEYAGKQGVQWDMAANALIRQAEAAGVYDVERIRGRGAWWDVDPATGAGAAVLHVGDGLVVGGRRVPIGTLPGRYIYEAAAPMSVEVDDSLGVDDANKLLDIAELVNWEHDISARLFAGWCAVAPVCGALTWRPHVWLTGPAGSGKTWVMDKIARRLFGAVGLAVQSETTEAGLRQTLGQDARPVTFDEIEGEDERAQMRVQNVLALARQASSETGAVIIKGSALGVAKTYRIRSCFGFSSIGVGVDKYADVTRVTVLSVLDKNRVSGSKEKFKRLSGMVDETLTAAYAQRFVARSIRLLPQIRANAATFAAAGAAVLGSQRVGDQVGALLAGCYSLFADDVIGADEARDWVAEQTWVEQRSVQDVTDEQRCLQRILEHVLRVQSKSGPLERSVGELIRATATLSNDKVTQGEAEEILWRMGLRIDRRGSDDDTFTVSNTHTAIEGVLRGTPWARGWGRVLRRVPGARPTENIVRFGAIQGRGVEIPLEVVG